MGTKTEESGSLPLFQDARSALDAALATRRPQFIHVASKLIKEGDTSVTMDYVLNVVHGLLSALTEVQTENLNLKEDAESWDEKRERAAELLTELQQLMENK